MGRNMADYLERRRDKNDNDVPGQMSAARFMQLAKEVHHGNDPQGVIARRLTAEVEAQGEQNEGNWPADTARLGVDDQGNPILIPTDALPLPAHVRYAPKGGAEQAWLDAEIRSVMA